MKQFTNKSIIMYLIFSCKTWKNDIFLSTSISFMLIIHKFFFYKNHPINYVKKLMYYYNLL